jgi:hypothetical protein
MKDWMTVLAVLTALCSKTNAACTARSVDACVSQSQLPAMNSVDPSQFVASEYCIKAPIEAKKVFVCITECGLWNQASSSRNLQAELLTVEAYCRDQGRGCGSIVDKYVSFNETYGSQRVSDLIDTIIDAFNNKANQLKLFLLNANCQTLFWARARQLQIAGECVYLKQLQAMQAADNYKLTTAYYICGAESGSGLFEYIDTETCNDKRMESRVSNRCAVTCELASANSERQFCRLLQNQLDCILSETEGCSAVQSRFVVPRLDSYWAANQLLGCQITIKDVAVSPRAACSIDSLLSSCFNVSSSSFASLDAVKQLFIMQFTMTQICTKLKKPNGRSEMISQCIDAMRACQLPVSQSYNSPPFNADASAYAAVDYRPLLGPFAVNVFGLQTLIGNLEPNTCQSTGHVQCASTPTIPPVTTTTPKPTPRKIQRTTPTQRPKYTPKPS